MIPGDIPTPASSLLMTAAMVILAGTWPSSSSSDVLVSAWSSSSSSSSSCGAAPSLILTPPASSWRRRRHHLRPSPSPRLHYGATSSSSSSSRMMDDIVHLPVSAGATSSSSVEADVIVPRPPIDVAIIVRSLLEEGRMKDAAHALLLDATTTSNDDDDDDLRAVASPPPPTASTYHEVIEAMCAGGGGGGADRSKRDDDIGNIDDRDMMDLAEELLISMGGRVGVGITNHARAVVISGYARRGDWMGAMRILTDMEVDIDDDDGGRGRGEEGGYSSSSSGGELYRTVLTSLAKANRYDMVNDLLTNMRKRGKRPDVYVYNSLLKICATDPVPRWKEGLSLLSQCQREPGVMPDLITYTTAMRACARGRKAGKAMELYRAVRDMGTLTLDVYFYTTAMDACAKEGGRRWMAVALSLLDEMIGGGIVPNEVTYGVAVTACGNGGRWVEALELLDRMRDAGLRINTITYNSAIAALSRAARSESRQQHQQRAVASSSSGGDSSSVAAADADVLWEKASNLMKCMEDEGVRRDSFTYSSAIGVCGAAGRWREAVDLITKMKGDGARPNRVAYTSAITACASSRQWESAFDLFNEMKSDGLQPDIVAYNALIGAGMNSNRPIEVYDIWSEMCHKNSSERVSPDIVTLTEVIATLDKAPGRMNRERVDEVFSEAVKRGLILRKDSLDTSLEVDLSSMSFPIARAACRFIFRRIAERSSIDGEISDLSLITGPSRMREYVREVLRDELTPPVYCVVPKAEQGTLLVKKQVLTNYIRGQQ